MTGRSNAVGGGSGETLVKGNITTDMSGPSFLDRPGVYYSSGEELIVEDASFGTHSFEITALCNSIIYCSGGSFDSISGNAELADTSNSNAIFVKGDFTATVYY